MYISDVPESEKSEAIRLLSSIGFELHDENGIFFFIRPLESDDLENVVNHLNPGHFTPSYGYRSCFIGEVHNGHYYVTSNIRGKYRGYRCRRVQDYFDAGNMFASSDTLIEAVQNFVRVYLAREYNHARG